MSALTDAAAMATDPEFRPVLTVALVTAAVNVYSEDVSTVGHAQRLGFARRVIASPGNAQLLDTVAWVVATNPTVTGEWAAGDHDGAANDLAFVLGGLWNALADV